MTGLVAVVLVLLGSGTALMRLVIRRRRDWLPTRTVAIGGLAATMLVIGAAPVLPPSLMAWLLVSVPVGISVAAVILELRQRRERLEARDLAIAAGMAPEAARELYRRSPRSGIIVLLIYSGLGIVWTLAAIVVAVALVRFAGVDIITAAPAITIDVGAGPAYDWPWWLVGLPFFALGGMVHGLVNEVRRVH